MSALQYCIAVLCLCSLSLSANTITTRKIESEKEKFPIKVMQLALSKVNDNTRIVESKELMSEARLVTATKEGEIDIFWSGASAEKDEQLLAIRIPILKGLLGHRLFLIRDGEQNRFANVESISDLQRFKAGQGTHWGDTKVLKNAGLPTVTNIHYANLFKMLEGGRFDYYPRAVHEPWSEVNQHSQLNLAVESNTMLVYPYAMYFYVNKNNHDLHDKIYRGMEKAIADGSYDDLFYADPMVKDALRQANLGQRNIIRINNPDMHPDTPLDRPEFWLDIAKL